MVVLPKLLSGKQLKLIAVMSLTIAALLAAKKSGNTELNKRGN